MAPLTVPFTESTMTNTVEYYCFDVKEKPSDVGNRLVIHGFTGLNKRLTLKKLREILLLKFGVIKNSPISYIDEDGDEIPLNLECEFHEALKLAKTSLINGLPLLVESIKRYGYLEISEKSLKRLSRSIKQDAQKAEKMVLSYSPNLNNVTFKTTDVTDKINKTQLENMVSRKSNISKQWYSDTLPPPWFTEYMESMKKDMVSIITHEVTKHMELLNKRLDSLVPTLRNELGRFHPSLLKRHSRPSTDLHINEKDKKRVNTQDEGQSSDASIERVDEPQDINIAKAHEWKLQQEKLNLQKKICMFLKDKHHRIDGIIDNLDMSSNKGQEQSVQDNNVREDFAPSTCCTSSQVGQDLYDQRIQSEALKMLEGEVRMNCSITGNQMLDCFESFRGENLVEDIDKASLCSGCFNAMEEQEQEDAFVMLEIPILEDADRFITHSKESTTGNVAAEQLHRDNSRDSPSFELLSETPSPRSSLYIDEEHFSNSFAAFENVQLPEEINSRTNSPYVVDIHGNIYNEHPPADPDEHMNINFEKRSDGAYSFVAETLPVQETGFSISVHAEQIADEQKSSQDNVKNSDNDMRNSSTNYMNLESDHIQQTEESSSYSRIHSQSQTDSGDFMQSFHSHTTSITDNGDVFASYSSAAAEQTLHVRSETATRNAQGTSVTTTSVITTSSSGMAAPEATSDRKCKVTIHEPFRDNTFSRPHQPSQKSDSDGSINGSRKTSGKQVPDAANIIGILPEAVFDVATHMGSIASSTVRTCAHVFKLEKLRSQTKEDPVK